MFELVAYTGVSTVAHVAPIWKIRKGLAKLFRIPLLGAALALGYSLGISWVVTFLFHFQSSIAGLSNLLSAILFGTWLYFMGKR